MWSLAYQYIMAPCISLHMLCTCVVYPSSLGRDQLLWQQWLSCSQRDGELQGNSDCYLFSSVQFLSVFSPVVLGALLYNKWDISQKNWTQKGDYAFFPLYFQPSPDHRVEICKQFSQPVRASLTCYQQETRCHVNCRSKSDLFVQSWTECWCLEPIDRMLEPDR